jgi:anti-sigma factor (TIGR02949 family)
MTGMTPMIDCDAVMRQLWDYLDGELTPERSETIRAHVSMCARCNPHIEFERRFLQALERAQRDFANPAALRDRVLAALRADGLTGI